MARFPLGMPSPAAGPDHAPRFFLGGRDLEMVEIARLLHEAGFADVIVDHGLAWGARASAYADEIAAALARGEVPVLVELVDDLPPSVDRAGLIAIDHHGTRAGADQPTSLEQIYDLVGRRSGVPWTRWRTLVAANDKGHAVAMRACGASPDEIRSVRDADRAAQGVDAAIEAESRRALGAARRVETLIVVETAAATSSAIIDFLLPEYGGPGECDVLVATSGTFAFYGDGGVIADLSTIPGCWYGGSLPERGFWGCPRDAVSLDRLEARTVAHLPRSEP